MVIWYLISELFKDAGGYYYRKSPPIYICISWISQMSNLKNSCTNKVIVR